MDRVSMEFTERVWVDQIQRCSDLDELKAISQSLVKMHFASKSMIGRLLLDGLPQREV